jgi:hypothetical protein
VDEVVLSSDIAELPDAEEEPADRDGLLATERP